MAIVISFAGALVGVSISISLFILNKTLEIFLDELIRAVRELKK